jgi:hypothetical protein
MIHSFERANRPAFFFLEKCFCFSVAQNGIHQQTPPQQQPQQSLAAQLQEVKQIQSSTMGIKEQLKRVFEKLRLQIVEEFLEDNDNAAVLQRQYHNVLRLQEDRHIDEKRNLIESYLLKVSALEAQLLEAQNRIDDLVQLQKVRSCFQLLR